MEQFVEGKAYEAIPALEGAKRRMVVWEEDSWTPLVFNHNPCKYPMEERHEVRVGREQQK